MTAAVSRRGRPRSEAIDAAILEATVEELIERGYLGLTIESIAERAGVAKTTVYRRWTNTEDLALAAMRGFFETQLSDAPPGSARDRLVWLLDAMRRKWADPRYGALMRRVVADSNAMPDLFDRARDQLIGPSVRRLNATLRQAVDEGLISPATDLEWVRQLLTAPIMAATLTRRSRVSRARLEAAVDLVLRGAAP